MDRAEFRRYGHEFIDWLADYFDHIEQYPVRSEVAPGAILSVLPDTPPMQPESMEAVFSDFRKVIMPGITHWQHPGWFAYFPANNSPVSVLAELLTAGLGSQCMLWQTSPAAAELEERMMEWLRDMLDLPRGMTGVIQDTASTATLCALLSARETATGHTANQKGIDVPLRVYVTSETHSSIEKGVKIAGFGRENLVMVRTGEDLGMCPVDLDRAVKKDIDEGRHPACVVATLGTTSSMAMDPVDAIGDVCRKHNIWLHVDAAFAGTAAIHPDHRWFMKGVEKADSFVFNPHKWMLTNFDCSAYFVKDPEILLRTLSIQPEYLRTSADRQVKNYRDWGIQLGRRFRALKLWFVIRSYGIEGIRNMVERHIDLARKFSGWIDAGSNFERMAPQHLSLVCFRYNPGNLTESELERINKNLLERLNATGKVYLTHTTLNGIYTLRLSVGQRNTDVRHVNMVWELLNEIVKDI
ncbi:MAG: pyridoxal-dependent decarboxylase [Bacteroidales bacterium]|nr:pyridoxal-dependent decarboxylase [Bacteroidales bacterium]